MKEIKFSVLMSVYYKENPEFLKQSLESIVNQTLKPREIVLVEDGKLTNDLNKVINEFKTKYSFIHIVKLKKNVGLGKALNEGLKHCKYEYVARMDSDDIALKQRFEKQMKYLINHQSVDVIGSNISEYDELMLRKTSEKHVPETDEEIKKYIKKRNPFNHMTVIYRKDKVIEAGSYVDCPLFEDYYLWCRMAKKGCTFYNIQDNLVNVRAGMYMIEKRGGFSYNKCIINFLKKIKKIGIINEYEYINSAIIRVVVSCCPKKIRMMFYEKKLRKIKN